MNPLYFMGWRRAGTAAKPGVRRVRGGKKKGAR
jgi:hypothetical protein